MGRLGLSSRPTEPGMMDVRSNEERDDLLSLAMSCMWSIRRPPFFLGCIVIVCMHYAVCLELFFFFFDVLSIGSWNDMSDIGITCD